MGTPSPIVAAQQESRRQAFEELGLFQPGRKAFGETEAWARHFCRYMALRFHLNGHDGADLFQVLMMYLLRLPDPLAKIRSDMARRKIDPKAWLESKIYELTYKLAKKLGNVTLPAEAKVIAEHEEYLLALNCGEDSIQVEAPYAPDVAAMRSELKELFWKELAEAPRMKLIVEHLIDMDGPRIQRRALANLLGVTSNEVNNILNEYARWVAAFVKRHH